MKSCIKCNIEKDDVEFYDGYKLCKLCRRKQMKEYRENNKELIKEKKKQYRQNNLEKEKARGKKYYYKNLEKVKEKQKRRKITGKTKIDNQKYYVNNQEKMMLRRAKRRAEENKISFNLSEEDIIIPDVCPIFGIPLQSGKGISQPNSPSLDRIIPEKGYVKGNIIVVSNRANTIKNNATPEEIIAVGEYYKKLLEEAKKNENNTTN